MPFRQDARQDGVTLSGRDLETTRSAKTRSRETERVCVRARACACACVRVCALTRF